MAGRGRGRREDEVPIEVFLAAADTYRLGEPIEVEFSLRNTSATPYQVLRWDTPLEDEVTDFLVVERDGERVRYDGRMVKRGDPTEAEYVLVDSNDAVVRTVDISRSYPIHKPGVYTATVKTIVFDAFPVSGGAKEGPRLRAHHERLPLPPASVTFTVVPDREPKRTRGEEVRAELQKTPAQPKAKAKEPTINGGTAEQQADTRIAHANAQYYAALSGVQLAGTPDASNALYTEWFGAFDQGRFDTVKSHYASINSVLESETVTYDFNGDECGPSTFAYTYGGSRTVWLCSAYISAPQIGIDCKFGTLIHEWSHAVADTDDHVYGQTLARDLAINEPAKAVTNADNHEYFSEELAQSDFGKTLTFITDRSQFGRDEVDALLAGGSPAVVEKAFYVHADGFWPDKLGITSASLGSSPNVVPTLSVNPTVADMTVEVASLEAEDSSLPIAPQRFTWVLRVRFTSSNGFPTTDDAEQIVTLSASLAGKTASAQIRLVKEGSPYEVDGSVSWLSTDVRVFQIPEGEGRFGATMGSTPGDASTYIKQVVANFEAGSANFGDISTDQQISALELSEEVGTKKIFNFAVAKVHYVGTIGISDVRVFFRLFPVSTTSTEFASATTYRRTGDIASLGINGDGDLVSIPCFAEPRVNSAATPLTDQTDPANVKPMPASPPGGESIAYFGAWLDINQTAPQFPSKPSPADGPWSSGRKSVRELIMNAHQCLVAEIAYDPDPIQEGIGPGASDKLAQRNLATVASANPGDPASHRIPNVFEFWPARASKPTSPDELLIDWGNVPAGTTATIFIPEIDSAQVVALANAGRASGIEQVDGQTISVPTGGISYVPLPVGATFGLTGLLTLDLPETVTKGEVYTVVIRQVTDAVSRPVDKPPAQEAPRKTGRAALGISAASRPIRWRRIVGSYEVTIPVRTKEVLVTAEARLLRVLRSTLASMTTEERWYPVFSRYVSLVADRVRAFGGDTEEEGEPEPGIPGGAGDGYDLPECLPVDRGRLCRFEGKVTGVIYDCFGDFEGFLLDDCGREKRFVAREAQIERLVRGAWRERTTITVVVREREKRRPISIILRRSADRVCVSP